METTAQKIADGLPDLKTCEIEELQNGMPDLLLRSGRKKQVKITTH
jgi:hypothetical protein